MLTSDPIVASAQGVDAAKTFLRLDGDGDDAVIAALVVAAIAQCECFLGATLMQRDFAETATVGRAWHVLCAPDVVAITDVTAPDGTALPAGSFETDIGDDGLGRVRATGAPFRARIVYAAGAADHWDDLPEPVRMGIVRLVAFHHAQRDRIDDPGPPRSVTALWQPSRRMRLQ
jgi:uncharacterized phiE125 gp8 family phage protein